MIRPEIQSLATPITQLKPHPQNVRQGDIGAISLSLEQHGQYRPIVVQQSTGFILAGNHTYKAAKALKWKDIAATYVDVDDEQALRILLIDNRANDLASYDDSALVEMLKGLMDTELKLDGTGFDPSDLDQLLKDLEMETGNPIDGDPDAVPDDAPSKTVPGDVWLLGNHRLMCGNSLNVSDLDKLMAGAKVGCVLTDPPYGINLDTDYTQLPSNPGTSQTKYRPVANDDKQFDASLLYNYFKYCKEQFWFGADYYRRTIEASDLDGSWLVWDKRRESNDKGFGSGFELVWSKQRHKRDLLRFLHFGMFSVEKGKRVHPTQKPVVLLKEILNRWAEQGCKVIDPFGGSGSTLIAAHQTGRTAYLMELDPHYCDVICKRFQQATGITPIAEATGNEHSFIE